MLGLRQSNKQSIDPETSSRWTIEGFPAEGKKSASLRSLRIWFLSARSRFPYLPKPMPDPGSLSPYSRVLSQKRVTWPFSPQTPTLHPPALLSHCPFLVVAPVPRHAVFLISHFQSTFSLEHNENLSLNHIMVNFFTAHEQEMTDSREQHSHVNSELWLFHSSSMKYELLRSPILWTYDSGKFINLPQVTN